METLFVAAKKQKTKGGETSEMCCIAQLNISLRAPFPRPSVFTLNQKKNPLDFKNYGSTKKILFQIFLSFLQGLGKNYKKGKRKMPTKH